MDLEKTHLECAQFAVQEAPGVHDGAHHKIVMRGRGVGGWLQQATHLQKWALLPPLYPRVPSRQWTWEKLTGVRPLCRPGGLGVHDGEHALEVGGGALRAPVLVPLQPQKVVAILTSAGVELQPHRHFKYWGVGVWCRPKGLRKSLQFSHFL